MVDPRSGGNSVRQECATAGLVLWSPVTYSARRGPSPLIFHDNTTGKNALATCLMRPFAPTFRVEFNESSKNKIPDTVRVSLCVAQLPRHAAGVALYICDTP